MRQLRGTDVKRLMRSYRRQHPPQQEIVALCQSVEYPVNVGSIFRLADGLGLEEVILTGITPRPPNAALSKAARGKEARVPWRYVADAGQAIAELKAEGYTICALEITDRAVPYYAFEYPTRVCLVVGHEDHGVTNQTLSLCDAAVYIPMYGKGLSLNVHVSLAIVCAHLRFGGPRQAEGAGDRA
ncbi:MAG: RNA methyltransferase [Anaerolineae bacterium]|nr:RNA methyltransferase [Anaerolineae bacterium]